MYICGTCQLIWWLYGKFIGEIFLQVQDGVLQWQDENHKESTFNRRPSQW